MAVSTFFSDMWSATGFTDPEMGGYAEQQIRIDTRRGVQIVATLSIVAQASVALLVVASGAPAVVLKTNLIVGVLSVHVMVSAVFVEDVRSLQMLGVAFLIVSAVAITFLAHGTGDLSIGMMAAIVMLFVVIPVIPWALREALAVVALAYFLLTVSLLSVPGRFDTQALVVLQLLLLGSAVVVLVVTGRNTLVRKHDIRARYELERAHREMEVLSMKDHLTGAWNRRFLSERFEQILRDCHGQGRKMQMAVLDIDNFKGINDRYGHHVGDKILVSLSAVFMKKLGESGYLVRLGGDEFQVLYCGGDLEKLIDETVAEIQQGEIALSLAGERSVTLSAGMVSIDPDGSVDLEELYKTADSALYSAKHDGRNKVAGESGGTSLGRTGTWKL